MKLHRLQLSHFRQYISLNVDFGDGITAIIGANGSGKSTLLEAICWALYGAQALRSTVDEVRPLFLNLLEGGSSRAGSTTPKVILVFSLGDSQYEVERTTQGARLYRLQASEREAIADGTTAVNQAVQRLLGGMTYRQFLTSFFAQQGELEFLHFDRAQRRREVLRMLGLERVNRSVEWVREQLIQEQAALQGMQAQAIDPETTKKQLHEARQAVQSAGEALQQAEQQRKQLKQEVEYWQTVAEQWNAKQTAYNTLQTHRQLLEQSLQTHEKRLSEIESELEQAQRARQRIEELRPLGERYKKVSEQVRQLNELQRYELRRTELLTRIEQLAIQAQQQEAQLAEVEAQIPELQQRKDQLDAQEREIVQLERQAGQLQQLQNRLEHLNRLEVNVKQQLASLEAQMNTLQTQKQQREEQLAQLEALAVEEKRLIALFGEAEQRVNELQKELNLLERQRDNAIASAAAEAVSIERLMRELMERRQKVEELGPEGNCPVCTRQLGKEYAQVMQHFDRELQHAEKRLQAALSRKAEAERDIEAIEQCKINLQEARADLERYQQELARLRAQLHHREAWAQEVEDLNNQIRHLAEQRERVAASYNPQEHEQLRQQVEQLLPLAQQAITARERWQLEQRQWQNEVTNLQRTLQQIKTALEQSKRAIHNAETELQQLPTGYDPDLHAQLQAELGSLQPVWEEALKLQPVAQQLLPLQKRREETHQAWQQDKLQLEQTLQQIQQLAYDARKHQDIIDTLQGYLQALQEAETQVQVRQAELHHAQQQLELFEKQWKQAQEQQQQLQQLQHTVQRDTTVRNWLREFADLLNSEIVPELQERAGELLNLLTDGRYTQLQISEDFEFTLLDEERPKPIISGGEEDIVHLSLRLAMAEMICERTGQPLGLLVLDEVFGSLDSDRRENTLQLLRRLRDRFDQIIIISHIEEILQGADTCLEVQYDPQRHCSTVRERALTPLIEDIDEVAAPAAEPVERIGGLFDI